MEFESKTEIAAGTNADSGRNIACCYAEEREQTSAAARQAAVKDNKIHKICTDGLVWIKNGQVHVVNEDKDGMPPMINPSEGIKLYINGREYRHLTAISESDVVEIKTVNIELGLQLDVEISEDKLKCFLNFIPARLIGHTILDSVPVNKLDIRTKQTIICTKKTDIQQIIDYLKSAGVVYGLCMDTLAKICEKNEPGRFLVAEGLPPEEPTDDVIEFFLKAAELKNWIVMKIVPNVLILRTFSNMKP